MRWRSPWEVAFRLNQEARKLALFARPPALPDDAGKASAPFPDPKAAVRVLRGTSAAEAITTWAGEILLHRFPLLGLEIETGPEIRWRRDYVRGKETTSVYFRAIPFLNPALNRHQHHVLLAQAYLLTGRVGFLSEIEQQLDSWFQVNRFQRGINWASALEVAFRSLSWMWVDHLVGTRMKAAPRRRLLEGLYRHAFHLEANLSVYFSLNTHLLGEAVVLHALGPMFRGIAGAGTLVFALTGASADLNEGGELGRRSPALGLKQPASLIVCRQTGEQAVRFGAVFAFSAPAGAALLIGTLAIATAGEDVRPILSGAWHASVTFPAASVPRLETC